MKADLKSSVMIPKLIYAKYKHVVTPLIDRLSKTERATIRQKQYDHFYLKSLYKKSLHLYIVLA
jgi:hypothetical protein